jgi:hypothetical protein
MTRPAIARKSASAVMVACGAAAYSPKSAVSPSISWSRTCWAARTGCPGGICRVGVRARSVPQRRWRRRPGRWLSPGRGRGPRSSPGTAAGGSRWPGIRGCCRTRGRYRLAASGAWCRQSSRSGTSGSASARRYPPGRPSSSVNSSRGNRSRKALKAQARSLPEMMSGPEAGLAGVPPWD